MSGPMAECGSSAPCIAHRVNMDARKVLGNMELTPPATGLMLLMPILTPMLHAPRANRPAYAQNDVRFSKRGGGR